MSKEKFPNPFHIDQKGLMDELEKLKQELEHIRGQIRAFDGLLRSHLGDLIVEEQELFSLYKAIKKAKKAKRLEQKKRGKNYKESIGLKIVNVRKSSHHLPEDEKERKRLYREAMLHVHPDKFQQNEKESEIATEITSRLIEIYKDDSLEKLRAFHAHIFKGHTDIILRHSAIDVQVSSVDDYLKQESDHILKEIKSAKNHHLYKVITEYESPEIFIEELKNYYVDRIARLKKRTRKGL